MSVTNEQVRNIARLARIAMSDEELERLVPELNNILGWVEQLGEVDTDGVEPLTAVVPNTLRRSAGKRTGRRTWLLRGAEGDRVMPSGAVIASAAKQSSLCFLDCFVAPFLAMTRD